MFQRIKASIDSALEQEQARARAAQRSPSRTGTGARRVAARAISPTRSSSRQGSRSRQDSLNRRADPVEFEGDFVIEDDEPSRSGTPRPALDPNGDGADGRRDGPKTKPIGDGEAGPEKQSDSTNTAPELPIEVRGKLRKLEKLESRYQELLKHYRVAHGRVQLIETFESALREHTPLTSISEPKALVEYLSQVNVKSDMVLDELKRVSSERDVFKERLEEAERKTKEAYNEAARLRLNKPGIETSDPIDEEPKDVPSQNTEESQDVSDNDPLGVSKSPPPPIKSPTINIPKMSLFSPRLKSLSSPKTKTGSEDLFSYDDEIPRLEGEVRTKQEKIEGLEVDIQKLKTDLSVTRESTQSMVQTLEEATREVNSFRESKERAEADAREQQDAYQRTTDQLRNGLRAAEAKLQHFDQSVGDGSTDQTKELTQKLEAAELELKKVLQSNKESEALSNEIEDLKAKVKQLENDLSKAHEDAKEKERHGKVLVDLVSTLRQKLQDKESGVAELKAAPQPAIAEMNGTSQGEAVPSTENTASTSKKAKKKKKKAAKSGTDDSQTTVEASPVGPTPSSDHTSDTSVENLQSEIKRLQTLVEEKDRALTNLQGKLKDQVDLREEIETLRDELVNVGQEHVEAREQVKGLSEEKRQLERQVSQLKADLEEFESSKGNASSGSNDDSSDLAVQFEELKIKASTLQTDLYAAQQLASSRFKDLENVRSILQKAQPEINSLRSEAAEVKSTKEALAKKEEDLKRVESLHEEMRSEVARLKGILTNREGEIKSLNQKSSQETTARSKAEDTSQKAQQEAARLEKEKRRAEETLERVSKELSKVREELATHKARLREIDQQFSTHRSESEGLKEEIELKSAQYASAQSLMSSMRDQTAEMATQLKEARERCESLDEEVAEAHRLLSERSREGETMRRLLADVESRADSRTREMKDRMDTAIEERDRAEEEASTAGRRRARELEDVRNKYRDLERSLKRAEEDKDELEFAQRDWRKRREELEHRAEAASQEAEGVRRAMAELRDALDESERQGRDLEKQKAELRRAVEESQNRLEKLQKGNKTMAEEVNKLRESKKALESEVQSSRTSTDSAARRPSLAPGMGSSASIKKVNGVDGGASGGMDHAYLKNVLLQFVEQKDKKYQMQLLPVLGMLLHFDKKDEQRWMSAITAIKA